MKIRAYSSFWLGGGGLKLKFESSQVRGFIGESLKESLKCNIALDFREDLIEFWQ